ncbi:hypothetical protein Q5P01_000668 [Channa striata]|uniref:Uncharacterized protein n=1 Tax=Channa striata TaxID=64152 RepID=A0AA88IJU0_CHASR|nr:hypothetical protein Q5P01_000668 [Channa striata]
MVGQLNRESDLAEDVLTRALVDTFASNPYPESRREEEVSEARDECRYGRGIRSSRPSPLDHPETAESREAPSRCPCDSSPRVQFQTKGLLQSSPRAGFKRPAAETVLQKPHGPPVAVMDVDDAIDVFPGRRSEC